MRGAGVTTTASGNLVVAHRDRLLLDDAQQDVVAALGYPDFPTYNAIAFNFPDEIRARFAALWTTEPADAAP